VERLPSLSIILPAYNEAENLEQAVADALDAARRWAKEYEVIVVNDGSTDGSGEMAEALAAQDPAIRVIHHPINRGMGAAVRTGTSAAVGEYLLSAAADNQVRFEELGVFAEAAGPGRVVVGCRVTGHPAVGRRIVSWGYRFSLRHLFGLRVSDPSWIKLYHRSLLDQIEIESSGFFWEAEVLIKARHLGATIIEVPASVAPRSVGRSSAFTVRGIVGTSLVMLKMWWRLRLRKVRRFPPDKRAKGC
jgi:glycosyltransferase involved in cell wall biosynthesis